MHAVSHSLAQRAHRAPPAARTRARWQPYNNLPSSSTRSSPTSYLHTPASSVSSASPTPLQPPYVCETDRRNAVPTPAIVYQTPRELQHREVQKSKYVIGLVDQAINTLCDIWHPQDIPTAFMTSSRAMAPVGKCSDSVSPTATKHANQSFHARNMQLPSPISPCTQPSPISPPFMSASHASPQADTSIPTPPQSNLVPIKGFVHEVLRRSRTSGSVLQTALCYLEAIRAKVPELIEKEKKGEGVKGEIDRSSQIVQGDLEAEEWRELALDSVMADFIHLDAAVDPEGAESDSMATVKVVDGDEAPPSGQSFTSSQMASTSTSDAGVIGLKSHLVQNVTKKPKVPSGPLPPLPPLPSPLLCPRRTFLAALILASKFMQDRCYSNKAWAKLSGLPPREIGRCERALGDALEWRLWVGKTPAGNATSNRPVVRSRSDGELFASTRRSSSSSCCNNDRIRVAGPSTPPSILSSGLKRSSTVPSTGFWQQTSAPASAEDPVSWTPPATVSMASTSSDSPPTPNLSFSPTSTESSSGDRTIQMSGFLTPSPGQFTPFGTNEKVGNPDTLTSVNNLATLYSNQGRYEEAEKLYLRALAGKQLGAEHPHTVNPAPYAYTAQPAPMLDFDPNTGLSYASQGVHVPFAYDNSTSAPTMYHQWTV